MATKKQKRAAALAKRERFMAHYRAAGLAAQQQDQGSREKAKNKAIERAVRTGDVSRAVALALLAQGILPTSYETQQ